MESKKKPGDPLTKVLRYLARLISSATAAFILLFYIGDMVENLSSGVLIKEWIFEARRITVVVVLILLGCILSWWREGIGGAILTVYSLGYIILFSPKFGLFSRPIMITSAPFLVSGVLFLICWWRSKA